MKCDFSALHLLTSANNTNQRVAYMQQEPKTHCIYIWAKNSSPLGWVIFSTPGHYYSFKVITQLKNISLQRKGGKLRWAIVLQIHIQMSRWEESLRIGCCMFVCVFIMHLRQKSVCKLTIWGLLYLWKHMKFLFKGIIALKKKSKVCLKVRIRSVVKLRSM